LVIYLDNVHTEATNSVATAHVRLRATHCEGLLCFTLSFSYIIILLSVDFSYFILAFLTYVLGFL